MSANIPLPLPSSFPSLSTAIHSKRALGRHMDVYSFVEYKETSLEKNYEHKLLADRDVGVRVNLLDTEAYRVREGEHCRAACPREEAPAAGLHVDAAAKHLQTTQTHLHIYFGRISPAYTLDEALEQMDEADRGLMIDLEENGKKYVDLTLYLAL